MVEMALNTGGATNWIDPEKQRKIERSQHPYAENPAFPKEPGAGSYPSDMPQEMRQNYAELLASDQYPKIVRKLEQALGTRMPRGPSAPMQIMRMTNQSLQQAMEIERGHEQELEQQAIKLVLDLPEFRDAKEAYEAGDLKIEAKLVTHVDLEGTQLEPEEPDEEQQQELQVDQIAQEMDLEKNKRRMVNLMIQGAAVNKNHAHWQIKQELDQINPELVRMYSLLMAAGEFAYWVFPEQMQKMMSGGGATGGIESIEFEGEDGIPVVRAKGIIFPVLVQELVKGLWECLSHREDETGTAKYAQGQADTLSNELWDIKFGAPLWRQFLRMVGDKQAYTAYAYNKLLDLPTGEFNRLFPLILRGEPEGKRWVQAQVEEGEAAYTQSHEAPASEFGGEGPGGYEDPQGPEGPQEPPQPAGPEDETTGDEWKNESVAAVVIKRLLD